MVRFPLAIAAAHLPVLLTSGWIIRNAWRPSRLNLRTGRWLLALLADGVSFTAATALGLVILGGLGYLGFASMRLLAQVIFGELLVVVFVLALAHLRNASSSRWRGVAFATAAALLLATYVEAYHRCPYDLQVRRHSIDISHGHPQAGVLRLVHVSDLQTFAVRPYERRVFAAVAQLQPDLLLLTGDYVQSRYRPTRARTQAQLRTLLTEMRLRPRYGAFALQGDVESEEWQALFAGLGITCLSNQHTRIPLAGGRTLALTGLDLTTSREHDPTRLTRLLNLAPTADYHLVSGHSPDFVESLSDSGSVQLALAGHTHGGQIVIPGFGPPLTLSRLPRRYAGGLHRFGRVPLHVSRGAGMERGLAPQVRFFCPPEICLLEVHY